MPPFVATKKLIQKTRRATPKKLTKAIHFPPSSPEKNKFSIPIHKLAKAIKVQAEIIQEEYACPFPAKYGSDRIIPASIIISGITSLLSRFLKIFKVLTPL